ncbi:uncharacterized protein LOC126484834 [Schistocerca serialis cubense]|uniref:uncharacterized protein LOC126484834 n=1 Tax=Schistocerca serialis cubense TaxID=2023355 RepID=UPI00214ED50E|nr:uncharacterized protein LOC126484834 [Schistocerca serialis cubense]
MFFDNLETLLKKHTELCDPSPIYNLDETRTKTTQQTLKVIVHKGIKQVSKVISREKGTLVTTLFVINSVGNTMPPVMFFPRVHFKEFMLYGAPTGTLELAHSSVWMPSVNFVCFMQHFIKYTGRSMTRQTLLICDNHVSHMSTEAINMAKTNGVYILTVPPHSTHRMHPLDVGIMKSFQAYYNAVDTWMSEHSGQSFTIYNVAAPVYIAHVCAMTPENIINPFKKTGIFPVDRHVYTNDMFLPSMVADKPHPPEEQRETNENPTAERQNSDQRALECDLPQESGDPRRKADFSQQPKSPQSSNHTDIHSPTS